MNELFNQLMLSEKPVSEEQRQFLDVHNEIMYCGNMAGQFVIGLARNLKRMKEGEFFVAAGFSSFEEYVEQAVGIKERQAYNYIKIVNEFSEDFLQSNAKIGITKLTLLASAEEDVRAEIIECESAETMTARELAEKIKELESEKSAAVEQLSILETQIESLEEQKQSEKDKADKQIREKQKALDNLTLEKSKLEKKIDDLKNAPAKVEKIDNPETVAELERVKKELKESEEELAVVNKKLSVASDQNMTKFKVKFEDIQKMLDDIMEILSCLDEDNRKKCTAALRSVIEGYGL